MELQPQSFTSEPLAQVKFHLIESSDRPLMETDFIFQDQQTYRTP